MLYYNRIDLSEETGIAKSNSRRKNICFVTIGFLIMGLNFKILSGKVAMILALSVLSLKSIL